MSPTRNPSSEPPQRPALQITANNLIKRVKRAAFGFTNFDNYRIRALLYAGKPNWALLETLTPTQNAKSQLCHISCFLWGIRGLCCGAGVFWVCSNTKVSALCEPPTLGPSHISVRGFQSSPRKWRRARIPTP